jgi:membrane associated rhomboid family serine protease
MIPIRDVNPSRSFPIMTIGLIVINVLIFLFEVSAGRNLEVLFNKFALIPDKYFSLVAKGGFNYIQRFSPFITSQFLHGGWLHVIGNMWFLWIFGDNIEDRLGHFKFILFYLLCGVAAGLAHVYTNSSSAVPTVGASGAIAGVMGAYTILYPRAKVLTLFIFFFFIRFIEVPAFLFLGVWFSIQFISGAVTMASSSSDAGIAWFAHIGGFVVGIILILLLPKRRDRSTIYK